jgi:hypothetical protein
MTKRRKTPVEFSSDVEMRKIPELAQEFFDQVLFDEESFFVSDEATIWDVSFVWYVAREMGSLNLNGIRSSYSGTPLFHSPAAVIFERIFGFQIFRRRRTTDP